MLSKQGPTCQGHSRCLRRPNDPQRRDVSGDPDAVSELGLPTRVYDDTAIKLRLPAETVTSLIQTGSEPHPVFYATGTGVLCPGIA